MTLCLAWSLWGCAASSPFVRQGDEAMGARRPGAALAAYDAAFDEAPHDQDIARKRQAAAAAWVATTASQVADEPPEQAYVLLTALSEEGRKRGATAAVAQHVWPRLEKAVRVLWKPDLQASEPAVIWRDIHRGEQLQLELPAESPLRAELAQLRARSVPLLEGRAQAASHPGTRYLYGAMAARLATRDALKPATELLDRTQFDYSWDIEAKPDCQPVAAALAAKIRGNSGSLPNVGGGKPVTVTISLQCHPLRPAWVTYETKHWVDTVVHTTNSRTCVNRTRLASAQSSGCTTDYAAGHKTCHWTPARYENVPDCSTERKTTVTREHKSEQVKVTHEEVGFDAAGLLRLALPDADYVLPLSARAVFIKRTIQGRASGTEVKVLDPSVLAPASAHGLWLELLYGKATVHEALARAALTKAEAASTPDEAVGEMVVAVKLHERVTPVVAEAFEQRAGLSPQHLAELLLAAPVVAPRPVKFGDVRLQVPRLSDAQRRRAIEQKVRSGGDGY